MEKQVISIIERVTGEVYPDANENSNVILDLIHFKWLHCF